MAKSQGTGKKSGGAKKYGRNIRKKAASSGPLSRYVRGKITFDVYAKLAGISKGRI